MKKVHPGTFTAGVVFTIMGLVFLLEAAGAWTFRLRDVATLGPLAILALGVSVLASSAWGHRARDGDEEPPH